MEKLVVVIAVVILAVLAAGCFEDPDYANEDTVTDWAARVISKSVPEKSVDWQVCGVYLLVEAVEDRGGVHEFNASKEWRDFLGRQIGEVCDVAFPQEGN